jgi:hypothetical protein
MACGPGSKVPADHAGLISEKIIAKYRIASDTIKRYFGIKVINVRLT